MTWLSGGGPDTRELSVSGGDAGQLRVRVGGAWNIREGVPAPVGLMRFLAGGEVSAVSFDGQGLTSWDSSLVAFVNGATERLRQRDIAVDVAGLPEGVQRLLALAGVATETAEAKPAVRTRPTWVARLGGVTLRRGRGVWSDLGLVGEVTTSFGRLVTGRARVRGVDVLREVKEAGAQALPIVTIVSFLLGTIMAFVGAAALRPFGTGIYVADVVATAMLRELAAVIVAIVMAGRTGSAYAAALATMNLTQELDALKTMGVGPIDFLVLPRLLALSLMLPLLCVYSSFVSIVGGALVAIAMLDLSPLQYLQRTRDAVPLTTFFIGVAKSASFGVLVAFFGCRAGLGTGRSAAAVGRAATTAMVSAIVAIIVADGVFAVVLQVLGI